MAVLTAVAIVSVAVWGVLRGGDGPEASVPLPQPVAYGRTSAPPWPAPQNPAAGAEKAGLPIEPMGSVAEHFHAHLDVIVNGQAVTVPANLGIDPAGGGMSALHTHDTNGVLHVEAPTYDDRYVLGQLFNLWQVRLDGDQVGGLKADDGKTLRAYVNGELYRGNPAAIELTEHRQIALVYGPKEASVDVPSTYDFSASE